MPDTKRPAALLDEVVKHPRYRVTMAHGPNPDIRGGGYWGDPTDTATPQLVGVEDFAQASAVCLSYIQRNELGGGNWTGGAIYEDGKQVAHVSYNGRVWPGAAWKAGDQPLYAP